MRTGGKERGPGLGEASTNGHPSPRLEHPGRGWTQPLGEGGRSERQKRIRHPPSGLDHPGQAVKPVTWASGTKKAPGRRTEVGSERKERGCRGGPKALVDAEASAVGRKEANEIASEQDCGTRGRGHADGHQMRNSPGDQKRHRKKAEENGRMLLKRASIAGEQNGQDEQAAHASGVARQGGRGTRPQGGGTQDAGTR